RRPRRRGGRRRNARHNASAKPSALNGISPDGEGRWRLTGPLSLPGRCQDRWSCPLRRRRRTRDTSTRRRSSPTACGCITGFPLSFREVEELMLQRGVVVSYETIRQWCAKFGQVYANRLRRRRARPGDKWHLDEVFIRINGTIHYLWRAVDQHGNVLDVLVQSRRNALAAKKFFRRLLKGLRYVPRVLVTDKLASYGPAHRVVMPSVEHRQSKDLNNRAESSHQPTRQRERAMKRFTSP